MAMKGRAMNQHDQMDKERGDYLLPNGNVFLVPPELYGCDNCGRDVSEEQVETRAVGGWEGDFCAECRNEAVRCGGCCGTGRVTIQGMGLRCSKCDGEGTQETA